MKKQDLIPHLFRTEYRKITAVLCKRFGIEHIETAEDIASDTFLTAVETWSYNGLPENPVAWLYSVAKNKAKNHLTRIAIFNEKIIPQTNKSEHGQEGFEIDLTEQNITDSQLQMLFAVCHPSLSAESQIGLALRILCGFGIDEIANAFLTNKETINKRLFRAKEKLREENVRIEFPSSSEVIQRLQPVLRTLYLLFSEGYYSESQHEVLRKDLCLEAMRLAYLLIENEQTNVPEANALLSLMCFHSSRFEARKDKQGELVLYEDQDETLWNQELIGRGIYFFHKASSGNVLSTYHLEAGIAYWYTIKTDIPEKWENILQLYNRLLRIAYSPIAALNRTYALSKTKGKHEAIAEAKKLKLTENHLYFALLGELYKDLDNELAKLNFQKAITLSRTEREKQIFTKKINRLAN
jgi:RNA polymerase sigma factor (sigma-70 family)